MRRLGMLLFVLGIGGLILPFVGIQFKVIQAVQLSKEYSNLGLAPWGIPFLFFVVGYVLLMLTRR